MDARRSDADWGMGPAPASALSGRVLVVDDNRVHRMIASTMMQSWGLTVMLAVDGQEAVRLITQSPDGLLPDLVLMDLRMPVMDGYDATQLIRAWEIQTGRSVGANRLPIIALTADAFDTDRQRCLAAGMDAFLSKPIDKKTLRAALSTWLCTTTR